MLRIERAWNENSQVYGVRKVLRLSRREEIDVARCAVARLMKRRRLRGAIRGKNAPCPPDHVRWHFNADRPNTLWVSDFTCVSTWQGFVYVAFVIAVFAPRMVGWRAPSSVHTDFVLDALELALRASPSPPIG